MNKNTFIYIQQLRNEIIRLKQELDNANQRLLDTLEKVKEISTEILTVSTDGIEPPKSYLISEDQLQALIQKYKL